MRKILLTLAVAVPLVAIGSVALWEFSDDGLRRQGALAATTIDPVPLSWRGDWTAEARLSPGDVVSHQGAAYVARADTSGVEPTCAGRSDCPWAIVAARGPQGPAGPQGAQGPAGPPGPAGQGAPITGRLYISTTLSLSPGEDNGDVVLCPVGKKATGGGVDIVDGRKDVRITRSRPFAQDGWIFGALNTGAARHDVAGFVVCANAE